MNFRWMVLIGVFVLILVAAAALILIPAPEKAHAPGSGGSTTPQTENPSGIADLIVVESPVAYQTIGSPVTIEGSARGTWYFEASFPIEVLDAQKNVIGQGHGEAQSDWMTQDFVPFKAVISFTPQTAGTKGALVLKNDNPSGDPEREKRVEIPVTF